MNRVIIAGLVALWGRAVDMVLFGSELGMLLPILAGSCFLAGLITAPWFLKDDDSLPWSMLFAALASTFLGAGFVGIWTGMWSGLDQAVGAFVGFPLLLGMSLMQEPRGLLTWLAGALVIHAVGRSLGKSRLP